MTQVFSDNFELQQGLFNILNHDDADWEPGDWSQPINPPTLPPTVTPSAPAFLQPPHEPQLIQLPSLFHTLGGDQTMSHLAINPAGFQSSSMQPGSVLPRDGQYSAYAAGLGTYSAYGGQQDQSPPSFQSAHLDWSPNPFIRNGLSSPAPLMSHASLPPPYYTTGSWNRNLNAMPSISAYQGSRINSDFQSYTGLANNVESQSSTALVPERFHQQRLHDQDWQNGINVDSRWQYEQDHMISERHPPHFTFGAQEQPTPQLVAGQLSSNTLPSLIGTPTTGFFGRSSLSQDTSYKGQQAEPMLIAQHEQTTVKGGSLEGAGLSNVGQYTLGCSEQSEKKQSRTSSMSRPGPFIHAICGKGFISRSAVKKHHWGPKSGDLETTRGCWAKNDKPDVAWNDHPSCKDDSTKKLKRSATEGARLMPMNSELKSPLAIMTPKAPRAQHGHASAHGLNTLVSAASYTEKIDAPKPKGGRNDSVVAHLDAQAAAAERDHRLLPPWMTSTGFGSTVTGTNIYSQTQSPPDGLGIIQSESYQTLPSLTHDLCSCWPR
ncbi:hypothetical protein BU23DRAFT_512923 [Bimuria novae-zelandiae CBS 107.79]|uniref:Uncharacterized protein n=1 Tax=Bimuria novae-zelandiae CBS 107.79 TaxID=1447943 RepID=A0A6A5UZY2_9PLEO|nr:hypothetical protein BU23DRAFT_512923 [Bimuria novae-zelandiae CBS 107.79]